MSSRGDTALVGDILEAIERVIEYLCGSSYECFIEDKKTQDAVIRNIEIIGEAAKGISEKLRMEYPNIPWKAMAGMRDRLIHNYFGVNLDIVWRVAAEELQEFEPQLRSIAERLQPVNP